MSLYEARLPETGQINVEIDGTQYILRRDRNGWHLYGCFIRGKAYPVAFMRQEGELWKIRPNRVYKATMHPTWQAAVSSVV